MWYQNICSAPFRFVTIHACDRRTDRHRQTDRITTPKTALAYAHVVKSGKNALTLQETISKNDSVIEILLVFFMSKLQNFLITPRTLSISTVRLHSTKCTLLQRHWLCCVICVYLCCSLCICKHCLLQNIIGTKVAF